MEHAYMPPAEPPPLEHDTCGAPHPKAAVAGPPARTAGFDPLQTFVTAPPGEPLRRKTDDQVPRAMC
jgi:hypothetical protein